MDDIEKVMRKHGAVLVRFNRHRIYQLPNGRRLVTSASPSDRNAVKSVEQQIRKLNQEGREGHV